MKTLNFTTIEKIQSLCGDYMDHFGYAKVDQLPAKHLDIIKKRVDNFEKTELELSKSIFSTHAQLHDQPVANTDYLNFL